MAATDPNLRRDVLRITAWSAVFPALALWPFLSALPALTVFGGATSNLAVAVQVLLFVTGFWGVGAIALVFWFLLSDVERKRRFANRSQKGLNVGCYATIWTALYMIGAFASR